MWRHTTCHPPTEKLRLRTISKCISISPKPICPNCSLQCNLAGGLQGSNTCVAHRTQWHLRQSVMLILPALTGLLQPLSLDSQHNGLCCNIFHTFPAATGQAGSGRAPRPKTKEPLWNDKANYSSQRCNALCSWLMAAALWREATSVGNSGEEPSEDGFRFFFQKGHHKITHPNFFMLTVLFESVEEQKMQTVY